ncbi:GMP synthase [Klebsiella pneumoniae]|uniref:GMP synthase n=1 Tax=Klebsiella pneumoniae TaxID=573 RepID=A0A378AE12_KLEPN|nr:GMP synthase [Klebsiella pneumoniae]
MTENIHKHRILILDFGSQYTQLVARRVRELGVYCELWAWDVTEAQIREFNPSGIILSGGPESTTEEKQPARAAVCVRSRRAGIWRLLRHADHGDAAGRPCRRF